MDELFYDFVPAGLGLDKRESSFSGVIGNLK